MTARWLSSTSNLRAGLQLLLCVPMLASCGREAQSDAPAMTSTAITQATFTLTAPKGMSVLAPAVESATSLSFGSFSKVMPTAPAVAMGSTGTTSAEPDVQLNDLWSRGPTTLKDRDKILGVVHTKTLTLQNITLPASQKDLNPVFDPVASLSWTVTYPTTTPINVTVNPPNKMTVEPGVLGAVVLNPVNLGGQGAELTLRTGTYYVGSLTLDSYSKVWLDQSAGPIIIYVATVNAFRGTFASLDGSPPDLFVGYFGTNPIYIETQFNGAIVAPNALMTLRRVTGGHTGFFAAKNVALDANAIVNYRAPNPVVVAAKPPEATCRALVPRRTDLTEPAQSTQYAKDLARYCGVCQSTLDSDKDGTRDCVDDCPYDPKKTKPGLAGCGHSEDQSDPDRVPDGLDQCDTDGRNVFLGECGCVGQTNLRPSGYRCYDPLCPGQTNPVCDGQGTCGIRTCLPQPDCVPVTAEGHGYFFCGGAVPPGTGPAVPKSEQGAYDACQAKGMIMARVDTFEQNQRIKMLLQSYNLSEAWLGGNQRTTTGAWRWAKLGSFDGDQFWSGGANGTRTNGRFAFWSLGRPGTGKCLSMQSSDGRWLDKDCASILPFVCENPPNPSGSGGGTGSGSGNPPIPKQPTPIDPTKCVPEYSGPAPLPAEGQMAQLMDEYAMADAGVYTGAASIPPANGTTCPASGLAENCPLTNIKTLDCDDPATSEHECDCAGENAKRIPTDPDICTEKFGAQYVCRVSKDDPACAPTEAGEPSCPMTARCGIPDCSATAADFPNRCDQRDICPNGLNEYKFTDADPTSDLAPQSITPQQFFGTPPNTAQSPQYLDEPDPARTGKNHVWCQLGLQDPNKVQPAGTDMNKQGSSGGSSPIKVSFQPDLIFDASANPLSFGQSNLHLNAKAAMSARVDLAASVLAPSGVGIEVFNAGIGIRAERCRITTAEDTVLRVFEQNISIGAYVPTFDTDEMAATKGFGKDCREGIAKFILMADRLKKAYRDAQQLLVQYKALKSGGKIFDSNFCKDLGVEELFSENFPLAGFCPENEPAELTINRFIEYYQRDGLGEIGALRDITAALSGSSDKLRGAILKALKIDDGYNLKIPFADFKRSETKTLVKTPFAIGPVPMLLEIAVAAGYGVNGAFNLNLNFPTSLDKNIGDASNPNAPSPEQIARASAKVEPWASAGMTVFVGANFGIGSLGIEGGITLAKVSAPIAAGVGLAVASADDTRPIPTDIKSVSQLIGDAPQYVFGLPKAYQFYLTYDYGASINLSDVLAGEVNGRLTIDFWLFSRTWRKRIVKFTGWSKNFPLISSTSGAVELVTIPGGAKTNSASDNAGMGRAELPLPFTFLTRLGIPVGQSTPPMEPETANGGAGGAGGAGSAGTAGTAGTGPVTTSVDKSKVEAFSYDSLCCSKLGEECANAGRPSCCAPLACVGATESSLGVCQPEAPPACVNKGAKCGFDSVKKAVISCCEGSVCDQSGTCVDPPACIPYGEQCIPGYYDSCCNATCRPSGYPEDTNYYCLAQIG